MPNRTGKDRDYFHSIYWREPGRVLFESATENPGFAVDEPFEHLGQQLRIPRQHEHARTLIEQALPPLQIDDRSKSIVSL